jgi:N-methylhydantoinase B
VPIFHDGRVVGWASMFGHMSDVGGKTPSSMPTDARTIYEEGVVIPPFKLYAKGELNEDALRIILNQVRMPDWNRADLNGLVAACRTAGRRVVEMCDRFGTGTYLSALDALLQRNYDAMKVLLAMVFEEGRTLSFTDYICDDGVGNGPYELKLSLTRTGEKVHLDFTGSSPAGRRADQLLHQREPDPDVLRDLHDHRGRPADPVERRLLPAGRRHDPGRLVLEAQAPGRAQRPQPRHRAGVRPVRRAARADEPGAAQRGGLLLLPHFMYSGHYSSGDRAGEWFQLYSIGFGGIPGRPLGDGPDGHSLWPSFVNIPCEYLESYYPLRIEKWETGRRHRRRRPAPRRQRGGRGRTCSRSPARSPSTTTAG